MRKDPIDFLRALWRHANMLRRGKHPVYVDYALRHRPRYGWGRPPHETLSALLQRSCGRYERFLESVAGCADGLRRISVVSDGATDPYWMNGYVQDLDAAELYALPCILESRRYVEIGSGHSTRFVARAREDHGLDVRIVSIDPEPRAEIDALCDDLHRSPLEALPLDLFDALEANDILMVDGSHRCFQNTDVSVVFLDVLPRLAPGVVVYLDDVFLPLDYPPEWEERHYSEQYLLAVLLLADRGRRYEVLFPGYFSHVDPGLRRLTDDFWRDVAVPGLVRTQPNGFLLRIRDASREESGRAPVGA
jgi:hypothetical protein